MAKTNIIYIDTKDIPIEHLHIYIDINTHMTQNTISLHTRMAKMCHMEMEV